MLSHFGVIPGFGHSEVVIIFPLKPPNKSGEWRFQHNFEGLIQLDHSESDLQSPQLWTDPVGTLLIFRGLEATNIQFQMGHQVSISFGPVGLSQFLIFAPK